MRKSARVAVFAASLLAVGVPLTEAGHGRGGYGRGGHGYGGYGHGGAKGSFGSHRTFQGSFGHRTFGHRSVLGHRSVGPRAFGYRSYGHRSSFGHGGFRHRVSGHHGFGRHGFGRHGFGRHGFKNHSFRNRGFSRRGSFGHHVIPIVQPRYVYPAYSPSYGYSDGGYSFYDGRRDEVPVHVAPAPAPAPIIIIQQAAPAPAYAPAPASPPPAPAYQPPARNPNALPPEKREDGDVYLWIEQPKAEVYLDEDYLGTGEEIASLEVPVTMRAGVHVLSVEHGQLGTERLVFASPSADAILIEVDLAGDRRGRKARIRSPAEVESRLQVLQR